MNQIDLAFMISEKTSFFVLCETEQEECCKGTY